MGTVTVRPTGPVGDVEGYPPLPADLRATIAGGSWEFPADLPISELETRLAERLRTDHDLADVEVSIDDRGRATIAAAAPVGALSRRVPRGHRAVSVDALVPTGMARGESVAVLARPGASPNDAGDGSPTDDAAGGAPAGTGDGATTDATPTDAGDGITTDPGPIVVEGTLVSARSNGAVPLSPPPEEDDPSADGTDEVTPQRAAPVTDGGEGRVTVAVQRGDAERLLAAGGARVVVRSRGKQREYALVGLLRRAGKRIARLPVREDGALDGTTIGAADVRDAYGVAVLAVRRSSDAADGRRWVFAPGGDTALAAGDEVFVVGGRDQLDRFREAVA